MAIRFWLGVAQRDRVLRGVQMGMAQATEGARTVLESMNESDGLVYYSPRDTWEGEALREFTAIGRIAPGPAFQTGDSYSAYNPWRRRTDYDTDAVAASIRPLLSVLDLSRGNPDWGYQLRRGLIEISRHDFELIRQQMRRPSADDR
ncbi:EVE domain-containing protein [Cryobacterium frigoriphilum]|uniref:EVE domain-containing protein n=1 Tax=Cryobacterium frigoriphilum TaxID=1259150 RepID=A0A4V3IQI3_9MICO|nr:EVE domain-containing protein [Cryobacterium frigoriphilum]TFD46526.1 EVE domain-containing protein [Cryobacterium frigoriphilum]